MAGLVDDGRITVREVHRFPNSPANREGHLRWDVSGLHRQVVVGLQRVTDAESIGIDTWGIDYGLLDSEGGLLAEPISYRDGRTAGIAEHVERVVPAEDVYRVSGVQFLPFNTLYQLVAEQAGRLWSRASHTVLIPDLLAYWLTGELRSEVTNASTTGLLDVRAATWSARLLDALNVPRPAARARTARGNYGADGRRSTRDHRGMTTPPRRWWVFRLPRSILPIFRVEPGPWSGSKSTVLF